MVTKKYQDSFNSLNSSQREAVESIEGPVMVVAGPGTGKTQVLTLRIANILLKTQVNPENILALTFTEAAALEMRKRLLSVIGQDAYRAEITTFHSFCNNFIKSNQEEFSHIIDSVSINEIEQLQIIEKCVMHLPLIILRPLGDKNYYFIHLIHAIGKLKSENVSPESFEYALENFKKDLDSFPDLFHEKGAHKGKMKSIYQKLYKDYEKNKELLLVFKEYQKKMFENKKYDYNDMLLEVIRKLTENSYLLQILQEKFQYFLVDEHQDTNAAQAKIVELLCNYFDSPNLFVVGDEKQAIFRFQGATLENFLYFKKIYPDAKLINLSENYRSTQTILDVAHAIILNNPKSTQILSESEGLIKKSIHQEEKIGIVELRSSDLEYFWIAEKINNLLVNNSTLGHNIAVLARKNKDIDSLISIFDSFKIQYIVESDSNILDDLDVQKLILLFRTLNEPLKNRDEFIKKALLLDCFNVHPLDAFKLIRGGYDNKISIWDIFKDKNFFKKLSIINKKEIDNFISFFIDEKNGLIKKSSNERFDKVFIDVLYNSGLINKILEKTHAQEILGRIMCLFDVAKEEVGKNSSFSLSSFIEYIDLIESNKLSIKRSSQINPDNIVRIMTVHKSKGLEFDYVFVINVFDGHWGNSRRKNITFNIPWSHLGLKLDGDIENDDNVDERRLFYVALTRARKNIFLSYSLLSQDGREQIPSQFISEIPIDLSENINVDKFEKNLLIHKEKMFNILISNNANSNIPTPFLREYISELFKRQGLSVSALNNFNECPWKYFFNNLIRIPEIIDDAGLFGNAIHFAINKYINSFKNGNTSKEILLGFFKDELLRQPILQKDFLTFLKKGTEALGKYYDEKMNGWNLNIESEVAINGIYINDNIFINGKIDMIAPINSNAFNVYDFKTGKPKSRNEIEGLTKSSSGNYKRQLIFYKILLDNFRDGFYKMKNGIIEFIEPDEGGRFKSESFVITDDEVSMLINQIIDTGEKIINLTFWNIKCSDDDCRYCILRSFIGK
ncbi:MAG: ATP-dependent helicase [Candidatus Levybacteria bacterium]|nr:ATP-dependent helicase [Candidatus Levybacteria bacterium]